MESILIVFLSSFLLTVSTHPRNFDLIPKDFYRRQILQPIPGYIPVYIKADGEPIIRNEKINHDSDINFSKTSETGKNQLTKKQVEPKRANVESDKMNTEIHIKKSKNELPKFSVPVQSQTNIADESRKVTKKEESDSRGDEKYD